MTASFKRADGCVTIVGDMTLDTASSLLAGGVVALAEDDVQFDLAAVTDVDSSGLAVLFGWQRSARAQGKLLRIANPPPNLISLAEVYGVTELLPLS